MVRIASPQTVFARASVLEEELPAPGSTAEGQTHAPGSCLAKAFLTHAHAALCCTNPCYFIQRLRMQTVVPAG